MVYKLLLYISLFLVVYAEPEDKKWIWGNNNREMGRNADLKEGASARYEIYENEGPNSYPGSYPGGGFVGVRPNPGQFPGPILNKPGVPDGIYNVNNQPYGDGHGQYYPNDRPGLGTDVLTGPVPSWQQEGPYKEYDRCKCTERFNCNSPGISYGHCDAGKRYCCYSTTKKNQIGGPLPSRPVHSIENGILVGPGGPVGGNNFQRPIGGFPGSVRPGSEGFGLSGRPVGHGHGGPNLYSPEHGILVGPGGPSNRPNFGISSGFIGRSANNKRD